MVFATRSYVILEDVHLSFNNLPDFSAILQISKMCIYFDSRSLVIQDEMHIQK